MRFTLTTHARDALQEREIPTLWVQRVLDSPMLVEPDEDDPELEHRLARVPEHGNRVLHVVVNHTLRPARVVTAYFDRKMRKKL